MHSELVLYTEFAMYVGSPGPELVVFNFVFYGDVIYNEF
jgi:hypothetical protein